MTTLMAIGGAINYKQPRILAEFVRRAEGPQARLLILPQASAMEDTGVFYRDMFCSLGVDQPADILTCVERLEVDQSANLDAVKRATGIFIAGGNQMRLTTLFAGTQLEAELLAAYRRGAVLAGTSAGAAVLSKVMLAFGRSGPTPRQSLAQFSPGFGFTDKLIFDQHFRQRDRLGRLMYAVTTYPGLLGVGIDENTVAVLEDDRLISVLGTGAVTIVDGHEVSATDAAEVTGHVPIAVAGLKVHVLTEGCRYDIHQRQALIPKKMSRFD